MGLFVSIATLRDGDRVFNHVFSTVAPTEDEAIDRAKRDMGSTHPGKELLHGSIISIEPAAIREAFAELPAPEQMT